MHTRLDGKTQIVYHTISVWRYDAHIIEFNRGAWFLH